MQLKPGTKMQSSVCTTDVMVIKSSGDVALACGGMEMVVDRAAVSVAAEPDPAFCAGTAMGKRYQNADGTVELLCIKPGRGSLTINGQILETKAAKALPSSD